MWRWLKHIKEIINVNAKARREMTLPMKKMAKGEYPTMNKDMQRILKKKASILKGKPYLFYELINVIYPLLFQNFLEHKEVQFMLK